MSCIVESPDPIAARFHAWGLTAKFAERFMTRLGRACPVRGLFHGAAVWLPARRPPSTWSAPPVAGMISAPTPGRLNVPQAEAPGRAASRAGIPPALDGGTSGTSL